MKEAVPALLLVLTAFFAPQPVSPRVIDGDTVEADQKIRFQGVDTPETHIEVSPEEFNASKQCLEKYGKKASSYVKNQESFQFRFTGEEGSYGRKLAYPYTNKDLNAKLLAEGLARVYWTDHPQQNYYLFLQEQAEKQEKGLWGC